MISQTKRIERGNIAQWTWRFTKAIDASGHYIRATAQDGTDYPIAITCGHGNDLHAAHLCRSANSHPALLAALEFLLKEFNQHIPDDCECTFVRDAADQARAAIALAKGKEVKL